MIWNESRECISRDELIDLQGKRLVKLVEHMYYSTEYYRRKMQQQGLEPGDIHGLEDLDKLPFTTKEDLRSSYPVGMSAAPWSGIVRYHTSSEMAEAENIMEYTRNDIDIWSECAARTISMAGLCRDDTIQVAYNYALSVGGSGVRYGAEKVGAAVVPMSIGNTSRLIDMMQDLGVTGIMCTPSYLMRIAQLIEEQGRREQLKLKTAICGAEPWSETVRRQLQTKLNIKAYDIYGSSELGGFGAAGECECQNGMHIQEDYFIAEIIDPHTRKALPDGQNGELVLTTLHREGLPLLRYRTADITSISHKKCECGRTTARLARISKEVRSELFIRGNCVSLCQLEAALLELEDIKAVYKVCVKREHNLDTVEILIEPDKSGDALFLQGGETVKHRVAKAVRNVIGMMPEVTVSDKECAGHFDDRKVIVIDKRNYN